MIDVRKGSQRVIILKDLLSARVQGTQPGCRQTGQFKNMQIATVHHVIG